MCEPRYTLMLFQHVTSTCDLDVFISHFYKVGQPNLMDLITSVRSQHPRFILPLQQPYIL